MQDHSDEFALERHVHDVTALAIDADAARWREPGVDHDWVERLETVGLLLAAERSELFSGALAAMEGAFALVRFWRFRLWRF